MTNKQITLRCTAAHDLQRHANVTDLRPLYSVLNSTPSLNILPGSAPYVRQPHAASARAITQSS